MQGHLVEHDDVAGPVVRRDAGNLLHADAPERAGIEIPLPSLQVGTRDESQGARVPGQVIEVHRQLDLRYGVPVTVRVPHAVAGVHLAAAAQVIVVLSQQAGQESVDLRAVQQRTQPDAAFDEWSQARPPGAVVHDPGPREYLFEFFRDPGDLLRQQTRQDEVSEIVEEPLLSDVQLHFARPPAAPGRPASITSRLPKDSSKS